MNKLAALPSGVFHELKKILQQHGDPWELIIKYHKKYRFSEDELQKVLEMAKIKHPNIRIDLIDPDVAYAINKHFYSEFDRIQQHKAYLDREMSHIPNADRVEMAKLRADTMSAYFHDNKTIVSIPNPVAILHELGHADNTNREYSTKQALLRFLFSHKASLTQDEVRLLKQYIMEGFINTPSGRPASAESQRIGHLLLKTIEDIRTKPERETWLELSEILSNAKAYDGLKGILGTDAAQRGLPQMAVNQTFYQANRRPHDVNTTFELDAQSKLGPRPVYSNFWDRAVNRITKAFHGNDYIKPPDWNT